MNDIPLSIDFSLPSFKNWSEGDILLGRIQYPGDNKHKLPTQSEAARDRVRPIHLECEIEQISRWCDMLYLIEDGQSGKGSG